jgi:hypothetical protein
VKRRRRPRPARGGDVAAVDARRLKGLKAELARRTRSGAPGRWNADPEDVQRSLAQLVLSLVEFLRQLMERQAIRRMEDGTLTPGELEALGQGLMRLEEAVVDMAARFGLELGDLNLDLGPLGRLT